MMNNGKLEAIIQFYEEVRIIIEPDSEIQIREKSSYETGEKYRIVAYKNFGNEKEIKMNKKELKDLIDRKDFYYKESKKYK